NVIGTETVCSSATRCFGKLVCETNGSLYSKACENESQPFSHGLFVLCCVRDRQRSHIHPEKGCWIAGRRTASAHLYLLSELLRDGNGRSGCKASRKTSLSSWPVHKTN